MVKKHVRKFDNGHFCKFYFKNKFFNPKFFLYVPSILLVLFAINIQVVFAQFVPAFSDNFDDNDISEYSSLGSGWTTVSESGLGYILRRTSNSNSVFYHPLLDFNASYKVIAKMWNEDNDNAGVAFRINTADPDNFYSCSATSDSGFDAGIWQHVNDYSGTPSSKISGSPWNYVRSRWYNVTITVDNDVNTINCKWESEEAGLEFETTATDTNPSLSGSIGIWLSSSDNFKGDLLEAGPLVSTPPPPPLCGNGVIDGTEECDDGNNLNEDGCSSICLIEFCGDGVQQSGLGEQCDDGNSNNNDGCSALCIMEFCGDNITQGGLGEACDDGNSDNFDACKNDCSTNVCNDGFIFTGVEQCDNGVSNGVCPAACNLSCMLNNCSSQPPSNGTEVKMAFIADSNDGSGQADVLNLINNENVELIIHSGDFSYSSGPTSAWTGNIDNILGSSFPYLGSDGNHDTWSSYVPFFQDRLTAMGDDPNKLNGNADNYFVDYNGIKFVFIGEGSSSSQVDYINEQFANDSSPWRVCSWHHNMNDMNTGGKGDSKTWAHYQACQDAGAIVATGHEHSYSRTYTLTGTQAQDQHGEIGSPTPVQVEPGQNSKNFVFVSGMGGAGIRDYHCNEHDDDTWWASIFASNYHKKNGVDIAKDCSCSLSYCPNVVPNYDHGALFITFNVNGDTTKAHAYFKTIQGDTIDEFDIIGPGGSIPPPPVCGDGIVEGTEQCDDNNTQNEDGCSSTCQIESCGDNIVQAGLGEQCDDGNNASEDGCSALCNIEFCGDNITQGGLGEACDDGNSDNFDACKNDCSTNVCNDGFIFTGIEECDNGVSNGVCPAACSLSCMLNNCTSPLLCGNGVIDGTEECDDGNNVSEDGCSSTCQIESCGDNIVQAGLGEQCDDGASNGACPLACNSTCNLNNCPPPPGPSEVILDSFTESVDTLLTSHIPDIGISWTEVLDTSSAGTDATVVASTDEMQAGSSENSVAQMYTAQPGPTGSNQEISIMVKDGFDQSGSKGWCLFGRRTDNDNMYMVQIMPNGEAADSVKLFKRVNGVNTALGNSFDATISSGTTIKLKLADDSKKVYVDGIERISDIDNVLASFGSWGIGIGGNGQYCGSDSKHLRTHWHFDNLNISEGQSGPIPPPLCGNGVIDQTEECDDGNSINNDGCTSACVLEICGDGITQSGIGEQCDDGASNGACPLACNSTCNLNNCPPPPGPTEIFKDLFTQISSTKLDSHTPDVGTSWTLLISNGGGALRADSSDYLRKHSGGSSDGAFYTADAVYPSADYEVSVLQINGDTSDDMNWLGCRIQDANNMYLLKFNEASSQLLLVNSGSFMSLGNGPGTNDGSTVKLSCIGTAISAWQDSTQIITASDTIITAPGKSGVGMGDIGHISSEDLSSQKLDHFLVV
jgi:cysteine-rich repeat protein